MSNAAPRYPTAHEVWNALRDIAKQMRHHATTSNQRRLLVEQSRLRQLYDRLPEPRLILTTDLIARATERNTEDTGQQNESQGDGPDTGGCSICAETGVLFILLSPGSDSTVVSGVRLSIGGEIELIGNQDALSTIQHSGRVELRLPFELVDLDFSEHAWVAEVYIGGTWEELEKMPDCWRAD